MFCAGLFSITVSSLGELQVHSMLGADGAAGGRTLANRSLTNGLLTYFSCRKQPSYDTGLARSFQACFALCQLPLIDTTATKCNYSCTPGAALKCNIKELS